MKAGSAVPSHASAIRSRLLFIATGVNTKAVYRLSPPLDGQSQTKPVAKVPEVVSDLEKFLAEHGG